MRKELGDVIDQIPEDLPTLSAALSAARLQRIANVALNKLGHSAIDVDVEPRADGTLVQSIIEGRDPRNPKRRKRGGSTP